MRSAPLLPALPMLALALLGLAGVRAWAQVADTRAPQGPGVPVVEAPGLSARVRVSSSAKQRERSAEAVDVVDTGAAKRGTADLGEVLARQEGVAVQRAGGLGSTGRLSLNGLSDDQVRMFVDGVPLDLAWYPLTLANAPLNLVRRVELYRGVVPVRFGADALGGAVNLVTDDATEGRHVAASYQLGSFGTHRATLAGRYRYAPAGLLLRATVFADVAENDYEVDVAVPDARGKLSPARLPKFHDAYRATGLTVEAGVTRRPWARTLLARAYVATTERELAHNLVMTVPYGEAATARVGTGASLRYAHAWDGGFTFDGTGGWSYAESTLRDLATCVYDWRGACVFQRRQPGELDARPRDQVLWQHAGWARLVGGWTPFEGHALRLALAPTLTSRTGDERTPVPQNTRDPLAAVQSLASLVTGLEYELQAFDDTLEVVTFVKHYAQSGSSRERLPGGGVLDEGRAEWLPGLGAGVRWSIVDGLQAKLSYERAVRLPRADEAFGDGVFVSANPALAPETSHNLNLGLTGELHTGVAGTFRGEAGGFLRDARDLIVLLGNNDAFAYRNVFGARSLGATAAASWTGWSDLVTLGGNGTFQEFRNTSVDGAYAAFSGDRIPNRPWLFANAFARLERRGVFGADDEVSLAWSLRYTHAFFRGWESVGLRDSKQLVPSQLLQSLAATWRYDGPFEVSVTAEVQNLTDSRAFDFFGAQRPGRAFYVKTTAAL